MRIEVSSVPWLKAGLPAKTQMLHSPAVPEVDYYGLAGT